MRTAVRSRSRLRSAKRTPGPDPLTLFRPAVPGNPADATLNDGDIAILGRLPWSSNGTFLVEVSGPGQLQEQKTRAIYKPLKGERPLWDYPAGLYRREMATYLVSEALGWGLVPETVIRQGPLGIGSLQRFVDADFTQHYFTLLERPEHHPALEAICVLDLVVNNGDRKSGHCLQDDGGRIWAIDHGLSLHAEPKLRTVIWDFAGRPLPEALLIDVARLAVGSPDLKATLDAEELNALGRRARALLDAPTFPEPNSVHAYPWPLI